MMKSSKKTLVLLGIAVTFALAVSGAYAFIFFSIKNKTVGTILLSEKIDELSGKEARITASVSLLKRESENIQKLSEYFFNESEIVDFAKKVERLGPQSGTIITIDALEQGFTEKTVPYLNLRIRASGSFQNAMRLLVLLENFPGKLEWKTVRLFREAEATDQSQSSGKVIKTASTAPNWRVEASLNALNFVKE